MKIKIYFLFFLFFVTILGLRGQAPQFESYKVLKNINDVEINAIEQDINGFIWLGTNYGLIKYDGVEFKLFTDADSLCNNEISSLANDALQGLLWIGHTNGNISIYNGHTFRKFTPEEGLASKEISSLFIDNAGVLWFTTLDEGVYYYYGKNRKRLYSLNTDDGLLDNYVYSMVQYHDSLYYFATDKGISVYNSNQKTFVDHITTQDGLPDNLVKKILIQNDILWIGMNDGGVCNYNINKKVFSGIYNWEFGALTSIILTDENEIFASTQKKGVVRIQYDAENKPWYSNYTKLNGLIDTKIATLFYDREGNIWVGTKKGLSIRKHNNIEFFNSNSGFDLTSIFGLAIDNDGHYWIACQSGLYTHYRDNMGGFTTKKILDKPEFENAIFISIYKDINNNIWVGSYGFGVFCINPQTLKYKQYSIHQGILSNDIFNITGDSLNIWLSTAGGGVSRISLSGKETIKNFNTDNGLSSNYVYYTYLENSKKAWLATDGGGVVIIENDEPRVYKNSFLDSLSNIIYSITPDMSGNLWFNTADKGLVGVNSNNGNIHLNELRGLSSNTIQSVMCDCNNKLVIASNQGIDLLNIQSLEVDKFREESGLSNLEPNLNAIYKDANENIFIGTTQGIVKINNHKNDTIKPNLIITHKRLFLSEIETNKIVFNHKENNISFNYTALWFKSSANLVYRYKLVGYDLDWSAETLTRIVTYPKLPHGRYKFKVQVKLSNGDWMGSNEGEFAFKIKPPIWKTPWFIALSILLAIFGIYSFIKYRIKALERDKQILEKEVVKRTAEITMQKEEIEAQRDEIEAQRNYVTEQRDKIEAQNKDITGSIHYASRIQRAVLPPAENFIEFLNDYFIFFKPRDIVSGDFYYLNKKDDRVIIAAADCTGHGVPGAFMSLLGVSLLNQIVSELPANYNAATVLNSLRGGIKNSLRQTGKKDEAKDGMDISLCVIDRKNSSLDYAGAFNPLLVIRNNEVLIYKADKMPIGVYVTAETTFTNNYVELQKNDLLYLYSDGFQDQFGGPSRRKFMALQLRNHLLENSVLSMQMQQEALEKAFNDWKGEENQIDDILVIGIKV